MYLVYTDFFSNRSVHLSALLNFLRRYGDKVPVLDTKDGVVEVVPKSYAERVLIHPTYMLHTVTESFGHNVWGKQPVPANKIIASQPELAVDADWLRECNHDYEVLVDSYLNKYLAEKDNSIQYTMSINEYSIVCANKVKAIQVRLSQGQNKGDILFPSSPDKELVLDLRGQYKGYGNLFIADCTLIGNLKLSFVKTLTFDNIKFFPQLFRIGLLSTDLETIVFRNCSFSIKIIDALNTRVDCDSPLVDFNFMGNLLFYNCGTYEELECIAASVYACNIVLCNPLMSKAEFESLRRNFSSINWAIQ